MVIDQLIKFDRENPKSAGSSLPEKLFMYSVVRMLNPKHIIEVGVRAGHMTTWLALGVKHNGTGQIHSVDNWSHKHGGGGGSVKHVTERLAKTGLTKHVQLHTSDSVKYLEGLQDRSVDLVWIDGDHSYEGARADVIQAMRVAKVMVGVHDATNLEGVTKALEDIGGGTWVEGCRGIWLYSVRGD